jgi:hypothetical protein
LTVLLPERTRVSEAPSPASIAVAPAVLMSITALSSVTVAVPFMTKWALVVEPVTRTLKPSLIVKTPSE